MSLNNEQLKKDLGLKIKSIRNSKNYTQEQFCELIGLEQPNLSNIENGKNFPDITTLFSIIKNAGVEPNFLFSFKSEDAAQASNLDYEILDMLINLSEESKIRVKNIIEIIK